MESSFHLNSLFCAPRYTVKFSVNVEMLQIVNFEYYRSEKDFFGFPIIPINEF